MSRFIEEKNNRHKNHGQSPNNVGNLGTRVLRKLFKIEIGWVSRNRVANVSVKGYYMRL